MKREFQLYEYELITKYKFICNNCKILKLKRKDYSEIMKCGYENMADLNLIIAENGFYEDVRALSEYEEELNEARNSGEY